MRKNIESGNETLSPPKSSLPTTTGPRPAGSSHPVGHSSLSPVPEKEQGTSATADAPKAAGNIIPTASRRLVRVDYLRKTKITYAEAAVIAGVGVGVVQNWVSAGKIPRVARVGPYRIDREDLDEFLFTGKKVERKEPKKKRGE